MIEEIGRFKLIFLGSKVDLNRLLTHPSGVVRSRSCELVRHLCKVCGKALQSVFNSRLEQDILTLLSDSVPSVRMVIIVISIFQKIDFKKLIFRLLKKRTRR